MPTIRPLDWDSALFGRKIGVLEIERGAAADVETGVAAARAGAFDYILCRPAIDDSPVVHALGQSRFYMSDLGVTWTLGAASWKSTGVRDADIVRATETDIPALQDLISFMFPDSRFYNDPFFSTDDAELLHREWIRNSVTGAAADAVFWLPRSGFVTVKQRGDAGEIVLIGVAAAERRRGTGSRLLSAAMAYLIERGAAVVSVRTQLRNLRASNFYRARGFCLGAADVTFSRIVSGDRGRDI